MIFKSHVKESFVEVSIETNRKPNARNKESRVTINQPTNNFLFLSSYAKPSIFCSRGY